MWALSNLGLEGPGLAAAPARLHEGHDDRSLAMRHAAYTIDANKRGKCLEPNRQCDHERARGGSTV